jgi:hypothetical protein
MTPTGVNKRAIIVDRVAFGTACMTPTGVNKRAIIVDRVAFGTAH